MASDAAIRILDENIADRDGADPGMRDSWYQGRVICCLLRPGPNSAGEMEHIEKHTARRAADLGVELIVVDFRIDLPSARGGELEHRSVSSSPREIWNGCVLEGGYIQKF